MGVINRWQLECALAGAILPWSDRASLFFERKDGTKVRLPHHFTAEVRQPSDAVQEHGTLLGGRRQSRWPRTADGFAVLNSARWKLCILTWIKERECDPAVGLCAAPFSSLGAPFCSRTNERRRGNPFTRNVRHSHGHGRGIPCLYAYCYSSRAGKCTDWCRHNAWNPKP